jgi:hypothetical protein
MSPQAQTGDRMPESYRATVRHWIRDRIQDETSFSLVEITDEAFAAFMDDDQFLRAYAREMLRTSLYELVQQVVGSTRSLIDFSGNVLSEEEFLRRQKHFASRFLNWMEHTGEQHVRVMDMTRIDLLRAAEERRRRGLAEIRLATFWEKLASGLDGAQTVRERFTIHEIEDLFERTQTEGV